MAREDYSGKTVFVCYAIDDQESDRWLERLKTQLQPLSQRYQLDLWDDGRIDTGLEWQPEIEKALRRSVAAVLLVGPAFLASEFITQVEWPELLRRAQVDGIRLLILVTQYCNFEGSVLARFQAFKESNRPLVPLEALARCDQNRILKEFSVEIKKAVEKSAVAPSLPLPEPVLPTSRASRHNLPIRLTGVVGRDRDQEAILTALEEQDKPVVLASGFGGVGKSALANSIAWKCVERGRPFAFIAWVDVRQYGEGPTATAITFDSVLNSIAGAGGFAKETIGIGDPQVKADRLRELLCTTNSLLIFDNYEGLLATPSEEEKVAQFIASLPLGPSGDKQGPFIRVLMTTRVLPPRRVGLPIYDRRLESLQFEDSLRMMTSEPDAPKLTRRQWRRVWEILHGLPKYMQVAVQQLTVMAFDDWEAKATRIRWRPNQPDDFFFDLFDFSWRNRAIIPDDFRRILLAMTYFVGHARPSELRRTSGLGGSRFRNALPARYNASYIEVGRQRAGKEYYTIHPLMYVYCRAALNSNEFREFRKGCGARFVRSFLNLVKDASNKNELDLLGEESQNVVAAARLAKGLRAWANLIGFREYVGDFLRSRGYWGDYKEIVELAVVACRALGEELELGKCLVDALAWYYLRLEDVQTARRHIEEGYKLFEKHDYRPGMAQAKRHLGKAALLGGLDERYVPAPGGTKCFAEAEQYYADSLAIREQLQKDRDDQRLAIADMKLDLGRLYWLQGMAFDQEGRLAEALRNYEKADTVSEEARQDFEQMSLHPDVATARLSKAWGNLGNAAKEIACHMARRHERAVAREYAEAAELHYGKNLSLGKSISKKDEIAHALAGLAEVRLRLCILIDPRMQTGEKRSLLEKAKEEARRSHRLYEELAGPRVEERKDPGGPGRKTRDEIRTQQLIDEVEQVLANLEN